MRPINNDLKSDQMSAKTAQESDPELSSSSDESDTEMSQKPDPHSTQVPLSAATSGTTIISSVSKSIFKILVTSTLYSHEQPWSDPRILDSSGSGFVVDIDGKKYIATNAHVAEAAEVIKVRLADGKKNYPSKVLWIDHECDLAILELPERLQSSVSPLKMNDQSPSLGESVYVVGFPQMGEEICITNGVVSRRELDEYVHSGRVLLQYGVDAVINPGNSGGPVFDHDGNVIGFAFQGANNGQGFIIPVEIYQHMARDFASKTKGGFPDLAIEWQNTSNRALRKKYGLNKKRGGVLINKVHSLSDAYGLLQPSDIVTHINGNKISSEGTVKLKGCGRVNFEYLVSRENIPSHIVLNIIRAGNPLSVSIPLKNGYNRTQLTQWQYEKQPEYLIYHGVVLKVLTENDGLQLESDSQKKQATDQLVAVSRVLNSQYTEGYNDIEDEVITSINDQKINNMSDVIRCLSDKTTPDFKLKLKSEFNIVVPNLLYDQLDISAKSMRHHKKMLAQYRILKVCSDNYYQTLQDRDMLSLSTLSNQKNPTSQAVSESSSHSRNIKISHHALQQQLTKGQQHYVQALGDIEQRALARQADHSDDDSSDASFMETELDELEEERSSAESAIASSGSLNPANNQTSPSNTIALDSSPLLAPVNQQRPRLDTVFSTNRLRDFATNNTAKRIASSDSDEEWLPNDSNSEESSISQDTLDEPEHNFRENYRKRLRSYSLLYNKENLSPAQQHQSKKNKRDEPELSSPRNA